MIDPCTEYGLALAIEDFVPVVLAGVGAITLARAVGLRVPVLRTPALLGAAVMTAGGACKATWKLLVASEPCRDLPILEDLLFPFLAVGFALLAWTVTSLRKGVVASPIPYAVGLAVGAGAAVALGSSGPLIAVTAIGSLLMGLNAATYARIAGLGFAAALMTAYLAGTLVLPSLAARDVQSEGVQWAAQITNSFVQLFLLVAAVLILRHLRSVGTPAATSSDQTTGVLT
jgi:hypothetical protein